MTTLVWIGLGACLVAPLALACGAPVFWLLESLPSRR